MHIQKICNLAKIGPVDVEIIGLTDSVKIRNSSGIYSPSGKSGPKDQVALHCYYTSPSHWCTTHEVLKL